MDTRPDPDRSLPSRRQALVFQGKAALLRLRRLAVDLRSAVPLHSRSRTLCEAPVIAEQAADLWTHRSPAEFPLTAGKVHNLRLACAALHGLAIPAGEVFSFWKQLGRTSRRRGYTTGRELREGCLIANTGGGLCQLSNLLYNAALDCGFEIVERHAHSRTIPGSLAEQDRDATVFWNYVDLRFRAPFAYRLEATLTASKLRIRFRAEEGEAQRGPVHLPSPPPATGAPLRSSAKPSGDCLTCGMTSCFRNPSATAAHPPESGHAAFLLDDCWPEFQAWCRKHSREGDRWFTPLDGHRWKKRNYGWCPPDSVETRHATLQTLLCSFHLRRLPLQGAVRQRALLRRDRALAESYARALDPKARHLVIAQNLLPHLWRMGALGGRTFDVLMTRWPLAELQRRLDEAARQHPASTTLADFRADPDLLRAEDEALGKAANLLTPHRAIASHFGRRARLLDWELPKPADCTHRRQRHRVFFPASPLGRKGVYELAAALKGLDADLLVLGRATENAADPLAALSHRPATSRDLYSSGLLVLPAWIEHQPRLALRALANGIPVIASRACGLPEHPLLWQIEEPSADALHVCLAEHLSPQGQKPAPIGAPVQRAS